MNNGTLVFDAQNATSSFPQTDTPFSNDATTTMAVAFPPSQHSGDQCWTDDAEVSEPCSSLGTQSLCGAGRSCTTDPSPATIGINASANTSKKCGVSGCTSPRSTSGGEDEDVHEHVAINLSSGEDLFAKPYGHSVSGHHVMLKQEDSGKIWKATRSHREERFYVTMKYCTTEGTMRYPNERDDDDPDLVMEQRERPQVKSFLGEAIPEEDVFASAQVLAPFVPRFFGTRQVRKLRCVHDRRTPSAHSITTTEDFPCSPMHEATDVPHDSPSADAHNVAHPRVVSEDDNRFDAAAHHSASDIVATFVRAFQQSSTSSIPAADSSPRSESTSASAFDVPMVMGDGALKLEGSQAMPMPANLALRRATILPSKAPEEGRPLDHHLPRTADQLVDMIVLEDVCHGFQRPCVLDLKIGTRQYGVNAPPSKRASKSEKAKRSTSSTLGLRVSGFKRWNPMSHVFDAKGKRECFSFTPLQVEDALYQFFGGDPTLIAEFRSIVRTFEHAFAKQTAFRFYTSSVLLVYDGSNPTHTARVVMVDFAYTYRNTELIAANDEDAEQTYDKGYLLGIESLSCMLEHVLHRALQQ